MCTGTSRYLCIGRNLKKYVLMLLEMFRNHITQIDQAGFVLYHDGEKAAIKLEERTREMPP